MLDFIDTDLETVLALVVAAGLAWQAWIFVGALAILLSGRNVTYGIGPGLTAVIAALLLWVIQ